MSERPRRLRVFASLALLAVLIGCEREDESDALLIWSNHPDTAFFVERYNHLSGEAIDFAFVPNLSEAITQRRIDADVVVGSWVNTPTVNARMKPIGRLDPSGPESTVWIPLAFTLPTIVFPAGEAPTGRDATITLDELGAFLYGGGAPAQNRPLRFVPSYRADTHYVLLSTLGLPVSADEAGTPLIDDGALAAHLATIRAWQERYHESVTAERIYRERYLYEPWQRLIERGRLAAVYLPSDELLSWEFHAENRWNFRYLAAADGALFALENVVYAGIPDTVESEREASAFIAWLLDPDVQIELIGRKLEQRIDSFGFFGGFSTIERVNERLFAEIYPNLETYRFSLERVVLPGTRPRYWDEALERVVFPYLESPDETDLPTRLARWYRQRGD